MTPPFLGGAPADGGARASGRGTVFGQPTGEGADRFAIGVAAKNLESRETALAEAHAIGLDGALLRGAHVDARCFQQYTRGSHQAQLVKDLRARRIDWARLARALRAVVVAPLLSAGWAAAAPVQAATAPGTLLQFQPMPGARNGASVWHILYSSTDLSGKPVSVSGVVIVP